MIDPTELFPGLQNLIRASFPGYTIVRAGAVQNREFIHITCQPQRKGWLFNGQVRTQGRGSNLRLELGHKAGDNMPLRYWAQIFVYQLLSRHLGESINPYGILTGVRPVKVVHRWLDQGYTPDQILTKLEQELLISADKARLLLEVALTNRSYLLTREEASQNVSIYIGIPFCPSRCYYCSFPAAAVHDYPSQVAPFLSALLQEIEIIGRFVADHGIKVQSIYLGGGTPTILNPPDLDKIFTLLHRYFISSATIETTVEAGRPDTLNYDILYRLKSCGTSRLCINPQTMHDNTLRLIGRRHTQEMVSQSMAWARQAGFTQINMDLIAGLPGESMVDFRESVDQVLGLQPENITIHTLAVKRGSRAFDLEGRQLDNSQAKEVESALLGAADKIRAQSYLPYYLYRQKYMKASMENIGYALADKFCFYNIQMMEERQTIIGMGGGASSKLVDPTDWSLSTVNGPKDPLAYRRGVDNLAAVKVDKLRALI